MKKPAVTIIIPVYNVESILRTVLQHIYVQTYPIQEIILIDNHSPDRSVAVAKLFFVTNTRIPHRIVERKKTYGISDSYNLGAKLAKTEYIVTLHSDSAPQTKRELERLMRPLIKSSHTYVASIPLVVHRRREWRTYNFWQKCLFAQVVGKEEHSLNGKFDAYKRDVFLMLHGFDTTHFSHNVGSEDADMHFRLKERGEVAASQAKVVHLHGKNPNYALMDWIARRRFLCTAYSQQLRLHYKETGWGLVYFFIKPAIAIISIGALIHPIWALPLFLFPFFYMKVMFLDAETRNNPRIFALPFIMVYLVYVESYWIIKNIVQKPK